MNRQIAVTLMLVGSLWACTERTEAAVPAGRKTDSIGGTVELGLGTRVAYRPTTLSATGAVGGTMSLQGVPADSLIPITRDSTVCGDSASITGGHGGMSPGNVLIWVDGIAAGKPLPEIRRQTLVIERCRFEPRLMAVAAGTTINVVSKDHTTHTSKFFREGTNEPIETIYMMDAGQVVPSEKIARQPGIVEVRHVEHPWTKGFIAVFDHPYFAVTDAKGSFRIDSLPPGTYTVKVWHERLSQPAEQRVVVNTGGVGRLEMMLSLK